MQSEKVFERQVRLWLSMQGIMHIKLDSAPSGYRGLPDLLMLLPKGEAVFIELKTNDGVVAPHQQQTLDKLDKLGYTTYVLRPKDFEFFKRATLIELRDS